MPRYAVTVQHNLSPDHKNRWPRAYKPSSNTRRIITNADSVMRAARIITDSYSAEGTQPRIVCIEELAAWSADDITDQQINEALISDQFGTDIWPENYDYDQDLAEDYDLPSLIQQVQQSLSESELVPGLEISLMHTDFGVDAAMVEIYDPASGTYRAKFSEIENLFTQRPAKGWSGVLSLARGIMVIAEDLM